MKHCEYEVHRWWYSTYKFKGLKIKRNSLEHILEQVLSCFTLPGKKAGKQKAGGVGRVGGGGKTGETFMPSSPLFIRMFHWIVQWMLFFRQMYLALQNPEFPTWLYILITKHAKHLFDGKTSIPNPSFFWPFRSKTTLCFRGIKEQQIVSTTKNGGLHSRFSTCSWNSKKHSRKRPQGFWIWKETIKKNQI